MKKIFILLFTASIYTCAVAQEQARLYFNQAVDTEESNPESALKLYTRAIKEWSSFGFAYFYRAKLKKKQGDYSGSLKDFDNAVKLYNGNTYKNEVYYQRGILKNQMGDIAGALYDYKEQLYINGNSSEDNMQNTFVLYNRAILYLNNKEYELTIKDLDKAILINTKFAEAYYLRGLAYLNITKDKEGCDDFKKAADLGNPDGISALKELCK